VTRLAIGCALAACAPHAPPRTVLDDQPPRLVSAFFGLDHAMPERSRGLCWTAPGQDGMPVTFSRRVVGSIDPDAFTAHLRSGALRHPTCATTKPANGLSKDHTVLLIGDLGHEPDDPPVAGPGLVLALGVRAGAIDSDCPAGTRQIVVAIWAGGVQPAPGKTQRDHLAGYRVTTTAGDVAPLALGDLDDHDNYVHLCLDRDELARRVRFAAGIVVDPRGDLNPETSIEVSPQE
jgi:hypothetical protein